MLKDYFISSNNYFIQSSFKNINIRDDFIIILYFNIKFKKGYLKNCKKLYFQNCLFFPNIEKIILINKKSMIIYDYMFNKIKRVNYILFKDILTNYNNLFITKKDKYLYELDNNNDFMFKEKYLFINNDFKYHKYIMAKKNFLYCLSYIEFKNIFKKNNKDISSNFINNES